MLFKKDFEYNDDSLTAALEIMEKTIFKKKKMASFSVFLFSAILLLAACIITDEITIFNILIILFFVIFPIVSMGSFRKEFIQRNSPSAIGKYTSLSKTITVFDDCINVYAEYIDEDAIEIKSCNDEEFAKYAEEMKEEMSNINYSYSKSRCYESDKAFMIYRKRDDNEVILKSILDSKEVEALKNILVKKFDKRYEYVKS